MGIDTEENKQPAKDEVKTEVIEEQKLENLQTTRQVKNIRSLVKELQDVIIQKYEDRPCLYKGKKFDLRVYMVISCTKPYLVLYNDGYCRISLNDFNLEDYNTKEGKITHMTNNSVQKKHPEYKDRKEDTIIDMQTLKKYLVDQGTVASEEEYDTKVTNRIKEIMRLMFLQIKDRLDRTYGCFELLGWDFLLDENLNPLLIEININPALFTDTLTQKRIIPRLIRDIVDIEMRVHKHNQTDCPEETFSSVVESIVKGKEDSGEPEYYLSILYQEGVESIPFC